jgi:nucleoside-triphosphatase
MKAKTVNVLKRFFFLTGRPGVGKTSVLIRAVEELKRKGYRVSGMLSREVRERGVRVGFEIIDFPSGRRGWLAHVNQPTGPKVGKYKVNLKDLDFVGVDSIRNATQNAQIVIIDEIGPMELFSKAFKEAVIEAMKTGKPILGTIHFRARDPLINFIRNRDATEILEVTHENRAFLHNRLVEKIISALSSLSRSGH